MEEEGDDPLLGRCPLVFRAVDEGAGALSPCAGDAGTEAVSPCACHAGAQAVSPFAVDAGAREGAGPGAVTVGEERAATPSPAQKPTATPQTWDIQVTTAGDRGGDADKGGPGEASHVGSLRSFLKG